MILLFMLRECYYDLKDRRAFEVLSKGSHVILEKAFNGEFKKMVKMYLS